MHGVAVSIFVNVFIRSSAFVLCHGCQRFVLQEFRERSLKGLRASRVERRLLHAVWRLSRLSVRNERYV
jgi:hypothetical protein